MEATRNRARQHRRRKNGGAMLILAFIILGIGLAIYVVFSSLLTLTNAMPLASEDILENSSPAINLQFTTPASNAPSIALSSANIDSINDTGYLALINRQHAIAPGAGDGMLVSAWPAVPVSFIDGLYLHQTALQAISNMLNTAINEGFVSFFVSSGYRCQILQTTLYDNGANRAFALPP
ncbi:MAG: hypothetical protein FWC67_04575, partial [Defluviitaleaceae bacterium]|nr:hypothetical protein [Defluviitaleaceae bacterium]